MKNAKDKERVYRYLQLLLIVDAIFYLLAMFRIVIPNFALSLVAFVFVLTTVTAICMYKYKIVWVFMLLLVFGIYYNPFALIIDATQPSVILEIIIAFSLFLIALLWEKVLAFHIINELSSESGK